MAPKIIAFDTAQITNIGSMNRVQGTATTGYIYLPGAGSEFTTSSFSAANLQGDLTIDIKVALDNWIPATGQFLCGKGNSSLSAGQWRVYVNTDGHLRLSISTNGIGLNDAASSSVIPGTTNGLPIWLRITRILSTGVVTFYTSSDGITFTLFGTTQILLAGSAPFVGTGVVEVGGYNGGGGGIQGKLYNVRIWSDATQTTQILSPDFTTTTTGLELTYKDAQNNIWTVNGPVNNNIYLQSITSGKQARIQPTITGSGGNTWTLNGNATRLIHMPFLALNATTISTYASAANTTGQITGDIDIRAYIAADSWVPSTGQYIVSKWNGTGNQRAWILQTSSNWTLEWIYTNDGITSRSVNSNVVTGLAPGAKKWVRVTYATASGNVIFYLSDDGVNWNQLGNVMTVPSGTIFSSSAPIDIGALEGSGTSALLTGKVFYVQILNGINGTATTTFDATLPNGGSSPSWTMNGNAIIEVP